VKGYELSVITQVLIIIWIASDSDDSEDSVDLEEGEIESEEA